MNKNWIATKEALEILKVHKYTLFRWADSGKIKSKRTPPFEYRLYDRQELVELAKHLRKRQNKHQAILPAKKPKR